MVTLDTAGHKPEELNVELLHGPIDLWDNFVVRYTTRLAPVDSNPAQNGDVVFSGRMPLREAGLYGYVIQITAYHPDLPASRKFNYVLRG
jgi:hypothetical protein